MTVGRAHKADGRVLTVHIPFQIKKRGGRKLVIAPEGAGWSAPRPCIDSTMVKALARAHRWRRLLESGQFASVADLAAAEKIDRSYLCRTLRLTLLAPDLVEAIVDGRQPASMQLEDLTASLPPEWERQKVSIGVCPGASSGIV